MGDALAEAFRSEIPCPRPTAVLLAALARAHRPLLGGGSEDTDEDLIVRLRDPRTFGAFAEAILEAREVGAAAKDAVAEHAFDLLPLPRSEGDVIDVGARAPPRLLALAAHLARSEGLTVLHVMHLVYAVFLDRSLLGNVPRSTRSAIYRAILVQTDANENVRLLYAGLHLAAVREPEASAEFRRTLRSRTVEGTLRRRLAALAASEDGGRTTLATLAQREGILPADVREAEAPEVLANIPRLPDRLGAAGRRYVKQSSAG